MEQRVEDRNEWGEDEIECLAEGAEPTAFMQEPAGEHQIKHSGARADTQECMKQSDRTPPTLELRSLVDGQHNQEAKPNRVGEILVPVARASLRVKWTLGKARRSNLFKSFGVTAVPVLADRSDLVVVLVARIAIEADDSRHQLCSALDTMIKRFIGMSGLPVARSSVTHHCEIPSVYEGLKERLLLRYRFLVYSNFVGTDEAEQYAEILSDTALSHGDRYLRRSLGYRELLPLVAAHELWTRDRSLHEVLGEVFTSDRDPIEKVGVAPSH